MKKHMIAGLLLGATVVLPMLQACVPVVVAGATAGALATFDRRSLGIPVSYTHLDVYKRQDLCGLARR